MTDGLKVRCERCGLLYDKVAHPECPRCRHQAERSRAIPPPEAGSGTVPLDPGDARGGGRKRVALVPLAISFALGAAAFGVALNLAVGRPWNAAPHTVQRIPVTVVEERGCPEPACPPAATVIQPTAPSSLPPEMLRIEEWSSSLDDRTGLLTIQGRATNVSNVPLGDVGVTLTAFDGRGVQVFSGATDLDATTLAPGEQSGFRLILRDDPSIDRVLFGARWSQRLEAPLEERPFDRPR